MSSGPVHRFAKCFGICRVAGEERNHSGVEQNKKEEKELLHWVIFREESRREGLENREADWRASAG